MSKSLMEQCEEKNKFALVRDLNNVKDLWETEHKWEQWTEHKHLFTEMLEAILISILSTSSRMGPSVKQVSDT